MPLHSYLRMNIIVKGKAMDPEQLPLRLDRFKETLRRSGTKMTHQRMEIFKEAAKSGDHPNAEMIHKRVRKRIHSVSLDTVYRTLWLLVDFGLITTLGPVKDRVRFDGNVDSHHHFVCTKCGKAHDFYNGEFDHLRVPDSVKALGSVNRTRVEFSGFCSRCLKQAKRGKPQ